MPKIAYTETNFRPDALAVIEQANRIIAEYLAAGFRLTLRQLYYQFVSRDWLPNQQREYKRLGSIINDARLAGLIDWSAIEDRGRNLLSVPSWRNPAELVSACADQFRLDPWVNQDDYIEVWIEKEALIGVVAVPCEKLRLPHFACKGYTSQSEMWNAGHNRLRLKAREGKALTIIHLGDHDPSGIDMTRDIEERLGVFVAGRVEVVRIALNMDQVEEFNPPPNPAKLTDSRFEGYAAKFGNESWELDALNPETIAGLIEAEVEKRIYRPMWDEVLDQEEEQRKELAAISNRYDRVVAWIQKGAPR